MLSHTETEIKKCSIHFVGNRLHDEKLSLSESEVPSNDEVLNQLLKQYFLSPFEKIFETFHFIHPSGNLELNAVYHFVNTIFKDPDTLHPNSQQIARQLYDITNHSKIKSGELCICYCTNLQVNGELYSGVGIFKSETKQPFLKIIHDNKYVNLEYETNGININKLDKGCLILDTDSDKGYKVLVFDQTNKTDALYWIDDFLQLEVSNDNYNQTQNVLSVYKQFVTQHMDEEFELNKTDKIELLNRSIKYFKENDTFNVNEFGQSVIRNAEGVESFLKYKNKYETEFSTDIADTFDISEAAVKKQSRIYKSILKLDKNFHIYIHGSKEMIERGFDEEKNLHYYKVYFKNEQ